MRFERGFGAIAAVVVLVILAALAAAIVSVGTVPANYLRTRFDVGACLAGGSGGQ